MSERPRPSKSDMQGAEQRLVLLCETRLLALWAPGKAGDASLR